MPHARHAMLVRLLDVAKGTRRLGAVAAALLLIAPAMHADSILATGAPGLVDQRGLDRLLTDLNADDFATRDRAAAELAGRTDFSLATLAGILQRPGTSDEVRQRLLTIARGVFERSPRGALGVQFGQVGDINNRLVIGKALPGYPSGKVLQPGDEILAVNGERVTNTSTWGRDMGALRPHIISRDPGQSVKVTISRPKNPQPGNFPVGVAVEYETLTLDVELGSFDGLNRNANFRDSITPEQMALGWTIRLRDLLGNVAIARPADDGAENTNRQQQRRNMNANANAALDRLLSKPAAGGEPQFGHPEAGGRNIGQQLTFEDDIQFDQLRQGLRAGNAQWQIRVVPGEKPVINELNKEANKRATLMLQMQMLKREYETEQTAINLLQELIKTRGDDGSKAAFDAAIELHKARVAQIEKQIELMSQQMEKQAAPAQP